MSALLKLAARVEAAEGPDRELDERIFRIVANVPDDARKFGGRLQWARQKADRTWITTSAEVPAYSASLDAAETIRPIELEVTVYSANGSGGAHVEATFSRLRGPAVEGDGATEPLARLAAYLRARQALASLEGTG